MRRDQPEGTGTHEEHASQHRPTTHPPLGVPLQLVSSAGLLCAFCHLLFPFFSLFSAGIFFYGLKAFMSVVNCFIMILRATTGNAPLGFSAKMTLVWHVSTNSDVPPVFFFVRAEKKSK